METKSSALYTDMYELTMLQASLKDGTANRQCAFEVFTRRLTNQRRYGVVCGTSRVLEAVKNFVFSKEQLGSLDFLDEDTIDYLRNYHFSGQIDGYSEGELFFPNSPLLTVRGTFAECVVLETVILSIMNADSAVATAAARMVVAADGRPIIEMGSRRTHESNAVTAARAAYIAGFAATSNLEASYRYGIPASGTAAHAWTLVHVNPDGTPNEEAAFRAQIETMGIDTVLLVDTYDIDNAVRTAIEVAGPKLGGVRIDSGDLGPMTRRVRKLLDELGAVDTKIVVSSDLDEFTIASLRGDPVDSFGVGTSVVTGSGAPTAEMVYKLVEVDGIPVAKRSRNKRTVPGAKRAIRTSRASGTCVEEIVFPFNHDVPDVGNFHYKLLTQPLMRDGEVVGDQPTIEQSRQLLADNLISLPWEGLALSQDEPAIGTQFVGF
ncbi:nicotinate phosphoribosyltransferase [Corynebacterium pyruviciproducens]|uniref:Nicotinate phosphoribosyltransferase n=2 Tax=Corynebacterium pyruviciproducens TaxID=598660 RepID=S2ZZ73_9CORY|nr:nicotinate phosphoribosyltransferase [Corynebacterium pyruviciproducens]EPD69399.1 nicotinate phosphoribosyltransferase [Corynebacterium pyruviciproducens ATCC BAA-1742]MDH4659049.1 nicotinate phosphoribosyltransferase [Corynebacterium pyruviciproducens]MDK6566975.1 nicotinate phosphoribosyltransferase [Corynebacterium pyruviciproducens]MDK7215168.1 nicotinate phosphoribosyltransferase [Corynebacterium pyruviciproducens]WOT02673.1 nicotinate phosphoribosyltransferase [Corynebacterium pyruvi